MAIPVLVVEDQAIVRQGLISLLGRSNEVKIVGEAGTGETAIALVRKLEPAVVILDIGLPGLDGPETAQRILAERPNTRVLALSAFSDRRHVVDILRAGASGYVVKDCVVDDLIEAIRTVSTGGRYISPSIASVVLSGLVCPQTVRSDTLTAREQEVLRLLADGKAMKEAAMELKISTKTVETHRRAIMQKLQLFSVAELTKHAIREGYSSLN